jgi:hypothetical protein
MGRHPDPSFDSVPSSLASVHHLLGGIHLQPMSESDLSSSQTLLIHNATFNELAELLASLAGGESETPTHTPSENNGLSYLQPHLHTDLQGQRGMTRSCCSRCVEGVCGRIDEMDRTRASLEERLVIAARVGQAIVEKHAAHLQLYPADNTSTDTNLPNPSGDYAARLDHLRNTNRTLHVDISQLTHALTSLESTHATVLASLSASQSEEKRLASLLRKSEAKREKLLEELEKSELEREAIGKEFEKFKESSRQGTHFNLLFLMRS